MLNIWFVHWAMLFSLFNGAVHNVVNPICHNSCTLQCQKVFPLHLINLFKSFHCEEWRSKMFLLESQNVLLSWCAFVTFFKEIIFFSLSLQLMCFHWTYFPAPISICCRFKVNGGMLTERKHYGLTLHHQLHINGARPAYAVVCCAAVEAGVSASHTMDGQHRRFIVLSVLSHLHLRLALWRADWWRQDMEGGVEMNRLQTSLTLPSLPSLQKGKQSNTPILLDSKHVNFWFRSQKFSQTTPNPNPSKVDPSTSGVGYFCFVCLCWWSWLLRMQQWAEASLIFCFYGKYSGQWLVYLVLNRLNQY